MTQMTNKQNGIMPSISENTMKRYETGFYDSFIDICLNRSKEITMKQLMVGVETCRRDLTKRQLKIIQMISMFCFMYGKDSCVIPKLMDFQLAGISKTVVNEELRDLEKMGVITWIKEPDRNIFSINDIVSWKAPYHDHYSEPRAYELFVDNLAYLQELKNKD